ncbi:MAG: CRISPR system precrRNA processing endoribonuclease RAMP protein Cas6 [Thiolinea sp.]
MGRYLMAIIRRVDLLQYFYTGHKLEADFRHLKALTETIPVMAHTLQYQPSARYSAAARRTKDTGGFVGQITLDLRGHEALWPFLQVGTFLNVGKNSSMGFDSTALKLTLNETRCCNDFSF